MGPICIWAQPALGPNTLGLIMVLGVMMGLIMVPSATSAGSVCPCSSFDDGFHYGSECCLTRFYAGYVYLDQALMLCLVTVLSAV